ncbi:MULTISPECIES: Na+/H+ antiporter NhaC family protein [unclassified Pseudodesulfovibrio]|uniref:Na+/H+ antiporter NhaC family protein n=1 Tax=unclassified Pseudodesulfovibrio TaxID=2661612 RepID=UPI000FEB6C0A|nr:MULTISPECIES: Na+/H+ antiporter NhaC family protein [unclassified Pseudodesulfovibrio]MCJ2165902.1 Na+/H+ antiporter NhaC family protein [Pseudodesulfovibrio sp. S3-i]RWU02665.1 Na+/H+ antiporter NhaC family protein [Pseudodesulfovibrio sp. S3]
MRLRVLFAVIVTLISIVFACPALAAGQPQGVANAEAFGLLTLIPPLLAIILAFVSKNVVLSLFIGVFSGCFMLKLDGWDVYHAIIGGFLSLSGQLLASLADTWNAGIVLQVLAIGGLIALISKMGGAQAIAEAIAKWAKTPRSSQFSAWFMGLLIFFDDYANSLTVGPIMRPVTDKLHVSREKLAFIIDATAAPIAGIALISTWVAYEVGLIRDGYTMIGLEANAYGVFVETIPYRFYNIFILLFILCTIWFLREFGPMRAAENRARSGKVFSDSATLMSSDETSSLVPAPHVIPSVWSAILPIGTLIAAAFLGFYFNGYGAIEDAAQLASIDAAPLSFTSMRICFGASDASVVLFQAALVASLVAIAMAVIKKIMPIKEAIETFVTGVKSMNITAVILLLAWSLSGIMKDLGTALYLVGVLSDSLPPFLLPSIIFILGSVISFATGTSYGTMGILMPLAIPLSFALNPNPDFVILNIGAVLTGAIFGDHCSPISDTTILSSMGAGCDHIDHVRTQLAYSLTVAAVSILAGYIPAGLGAPAWVTLLAGSLMVVGVVRVFGKRIEG